MGAFCCMSYCPDRGPFTRLRARPLSREAEAEVEKEEETVIEEEKREDQEEKEIAADVAVVSRAFEKAFTKSASFWAQFAPTVGAGNVLHTESKQDSSQFGFHS